MLVIRLKNETHQRLITNIMEVEDPVEVAKNINETVGA